MLTQMLIVGVGGSGGKTLRVLRQSLLRKLRSAEWEGQSLPEAWQMLWIDTKSVQSSDGSPLPLLPPDDYFGATPAMASYQGIRDSVLSSVVDPGSQLDALAWMPEGSPVDVGAGAGQYRALGRVVGLNRLGAIRGALETKYGRMISPHATTELHAVAAKLGANVTTPAPTPTVIVISSLAGGSGAGMCLDVVEAIKTLSPQMANATHTILYGPDVFNSIDPGQRVRIPVNTLAGLCEVMAGVWAPGVSAGTAALYSTRGIPSPVGPGFGGKYTYLIGASNGRVSFSKADEVYEAVGNALVAMVADEAVQDWLTSFVLMSVFTQGGEHALSDKTGLKDQTDAMQREPVASLGFSRLSLGTERLREYVAQAGGKEAVRRLLWPMFDAKQGYQGGPEAEVQDQVEQRWADFLRNSGLNELNPANDVVDALKPSDSTQRYQAFVTATQNSFRGNGTLPADSWRDLIMRAWDNGHPEVHSAEVEAQYLLARWWVTSMQTDFIAYVSRTVAAYGLQVTSRLLTKLQDHIARMSVPELRQDAAEARTQMGLMVGTIAGHMGSAGLASLSEDDEYVIGTVRYFFTYLDHLANAHRYELGANLLADFQRNVIAPLEQLLRDTYEALKANVEAKLVNGDVNPFEAMADYRGSDVPVQLKPGMTERLLIAADTFPTEARRLIQSSMSPRNTGRADARFLESCVLGVPLDARGDVSGSESTPDLIAVKAAWVSADDRARSSLMDAPQPLRVSMPVDPGAYVRRVDDKVAKDSQTSLGAYFRMGIADFLALGNEHEQSARRTKFQAELAAVLAAGAPMRNVNVNLGQLVHPGYSFGTALATSTISSSLQDLVDPVLINEKAAGRPKYGDVSTTEITFFQIDDKAMSPVVLDSFMRGIAQSWSSASQSPSSRATWWGEYSRARPLVEFVPVAPVVLGSMVTGWFLAVSMNLLRRTIPQQNLGVQVEIWDHDKGVWATFPYPMLGVGTSPQAHELLPAVLKSIAIALVDVNSQGSLAPLDAYHVLRLLGENHQRILADWVNKGQISGRSGGPEPIASVAGSANADPQDRKQSLVRVLQETAAYLAQVEDEWRRQANVFETPRMWEVRDVANRSLNELIRSLNNLVSDDQGGLLGRAVISGDQ